MNNKKVRVTKSEIENLIKSLPEKTLIPLDNSDIICLTPDKVLEEISNKTEIGKKYFIKIGDSIKKQKLNNTYKKPETDGIILS